MSEANNCVDRNGNGTIETSTGYGDVRPWPGVGAAASAARDECILHHIDTGGGDSRHNYGIAIDGQGNVWVSTLGEGIVRKFAPSGSLIGAFPQGNTFAQGLAVDNNDDVWISSSLFCGGGCSVAHSRTTERAADHRRAVAAQPQARRDRDPRRHRRRRRRAHDHGHGGSCTGTVKVSVPHDQGKGPAVDGGPLYDSTVGWQHAGPAPRPHGRGATRAGST